MLSNAAGTLIANGVVQAWRLTSRSDWVASEAPSVHFEMSAPREGETGILSGDQVAGMDSVLSDPRLATLIEAACLSHLVLDQRSGLADALGRIEDKFLDMSEEEFAKFGIPRETAQLIWQTLDGQLMRLLGDGLREALTTEERNQLIGIEGSLSVERDRVSEVPGWLAELVNVSTDRERLTAVKVRSEEIRRQSLNRFGKLELRHSPDASEGRPLESLYIHRTLQSPKGELTSTEDILGVGNRGRVVVTGPPGNGKSTLTQHLIASLATDGRYVPLLLRVREADLDTILLTHELTDSIRRLFQDSQIHLQHIEDLLTLGRAVVVFDGLDEILDKGKRQTFVAKIEAFAHQYPLCSILATSRENGYEDAPFSKVFTKYKLLPFTMDQVAEYAAKWFDSDSDGATLTRTFLRDAQPVEELVQNPLMLSLLCILYRNRGYIPRNRRAVYKDCADLLFRRWDSMRDIEQPTDHVEHGEDLMEEIALFYFKRQAAQSGVQERQLRDIIAGYLVDSAGVLPAQAKYRAKQFLDFCAGRAWLLGVDGTHAGERLFSFTHRTFMEYFAAEGMVRTNSDSESLANVIVQEYQKNPSSVLPDLIVMAAEAGTRGRVRDLLEEIQKKERLLGGKGDGRFLPLRLRIASVLNLQPRHFDLLMSEAFQTFERGWDALSIQVAEAMFRLPRNPRARIEAFVLDPSALKMDADEDAVHLRQELLLRAWVEHELATGETPRGHEWSDVLEKCWQAYLATGHTTDRWIRYYLRFYRNQFVPLPKTDLQWVLRHESRSAYGPYALAAIQSILAEEREAFSDIVKAFNAERRPTRLSYGDAYTVAGGVMHALDSRSSDTGHVDEAELKLVVTAAMLWWEIHGRYDEFAEVLDEVLGMPFAALVADRERVARLDGSSNSGDDAPTVSADTYVAVRKRLKDVCGEWAVRWTRDTYNLILPEAKTSY
jgi:hypothetical protein